MFFAVFIATAIAGSVILASHHHHHERDKDRCNESQSQESSKPDAGIPSPGTYDKDESHRHDIDKPGEKGDYTGNQCMEPWQGTQS